ncbi:hypothetical protein BDQ17DRAFT_1324286 [Cyathus striatus]|nr:hypothetical protein BDQ17DRAFT_1324286 [Cyathus striatus]
MTNSDPRNLLILYATETGNAQDAADYISRQCRRIAFQSRVISMDAYPLYSCIYHWLWYRTPLNDAFMAHAPPRRLTKRPVEDLPFAVFAKKLSRRMISLGATEICTRGEGDEQHPLGIDGVLQPWTETLLGTLLNLFALPEGTEIIPATAVPPPRVSLIETSQSTLNEVKDPQEHDSRYHVASVKLNKRITTEDWFQDVRHLEFEFEDDIQYSPGDIAIIHPVASEVDVELFLSMIGWGNIADTPFKIKKTLTDQSLSPYIPLITTLRTILTKYVDINAVPRRTFFQFLRYFTSDEMEAEKLDEFLSKEGADELYDYCHRVRRTISEVLTEFRSAKIPKEYVFDIFPPMRARQFSIASSVKVNLFSLFTIVKYRTKLKIPRKGVCTSYLSALRPGDKLRIGILEGLIKLPSKETPVLCVGPGTGVAPMRAVIEERISEGSKSNTLYFGCRSESKDHHYGSEWKAYKECGDLEYHAAFSRDVPEGTKRLYVQDIMLQDSEHIWELIGKEGAYVIISGSSNKMPAAVKDALAQSAEKHGGYSPEQAKKHISEAKTNEVFSKLVLFPPPDE